MKYLDLTLPQTADNITLDETLLDQSENGLEDEVLRVWEAKEMAVVTGYSNRPEQEVYLDVCKAHGINVFKRCSGGGTVLQGPRCLSYALILRIVEETELKTVSSANHYIMQRHREIIERLTGKPVQIEGHTDLTIGGRKFSGNAQRRKKKFLLFHGTFLLNFDLSQIEKFLRSPSQEPSYRQNRSHNDFLLNLNLEARVVKHALREAWEAKEI